LEGSLATDNNVYLSDLQALIVEHFSLEELRARAAGAGDESQVMLATTGGYVFGYWVDQTQLIGRACRIFL
jgi:hypothetical protein